MKILFLGKSYPQREIIWAKGIKKIDSEISIDIIEFSKRNYLDLEKNLKIEEEKNLFNKKISFMNFIKENYKNLDSKEEELIDADLKKYEVKYNLDYNFILNCDRTIINYEKKKIKILLLLLTIFSERILSEGKYEKVVGELSSSSDLIFYTLAKQLKINYLSFSHGRIGNKISIDNIDGSRKGVKELYQDLKNRDFTFDEKKILEEYLKKVIKKDIIPDYEKKNKEGRKFKLLLEIKNLQKNIENIIEAYKEDSKYSCDMPGELGKKLKSRIYKIKYPIKKFIEKNIWDKADFNKKYLLVPLHVQPEASTMTFAQEYLDQIHHIKRLSQSISIDYYLYVKEHPSMYIYRGKKYYDEIRKLHNVKLISPFEDQLELLKNSKGVITLTNTTGYEAILYKKPAYIFGKVFYQEYDYINKIKNYSELKELIIKNENYSVDEHNYQAFILATLLSLKDGNYNLITLDPTVSSEENERDIAKIILEE